MPAERRYSEDTAQRIDAAVSAAVTAGFEAATRILGQHRDTLDRGTKRLLETETLSGPALDAFRVEMLGTQRNPP